jgi:hypothetical protein
MNRPIAGQKALIVLAALVAIASNAPAQNCSPWGDVASWQATYALTGSGGGTTTDGLLVYTWTVNRQLTANATLTSEAGCGQVPGVLAWSGPFSTASGSGSSNGQTMQTDPGCGGPLETISWSGNAASAGGFFGGFTPLLELQIDLSKQTYTVVDGAVLAGTYIRKDCAIIKPPGSLGMILGPLVSYSPVPNKIITVSPKSFALPQIFGVLQQTTSSFTAPAETFPLDSNGIPAASWNLSFKLIPARPWVKVWMSGGGAGQAAVHHSSEIRAK